LKAICGEALAARVTRANGLADLYSIKLSRWRLRHWSTSLTILVVYNIIRCLPVIFLIMLHIWWLPELHRHLVLFFVLSILKINTGTVHNSVTVLNFAIHYTGHSICRHVLQ
jgi:hypothetical protein